MDTIITKADAGGFEGYGSIFYKLDRHGDVVMPGAYAESLPLFLKESFIGGIGHKHGDPVGRYTDAYEDPKGLYVKAQFSDVPDAKTVRTLIKDRVVQKLSVAIEPDEFDRVSPAKLREIWKSAGYEPNQDDLKRIKRVNSVRLIHKARLLEVSPVTIPSNDDARIMAFKGYSASLAESPVEFQRFMQTARSAILKLSTVETKAGRVISGKNEMKLRAMLEVLAGVSEELNSLLLLVSQAPEVSDEVEDQEETGEDADSQADGKTTDQKQLENDEEFAKQRGADKKSANLGNQARLLMILSECI